MQLLPLSTAVNISFGPLTGTDGSTPYTGLTTTNCTVLAVLKEGSAALTSITDNTLVHLSNGVYKLGLTVANLNTLGKLDFHLMATSAQPQHREFMVCPTNVYDALVLGTEKLAIDIQSVNQATTPASTLASTVVAGVPFIVQAGASTSLIPTNLTVAVNGHFIGRTVIFTSGTLNQQAAQITAYDGVAKNLTTSILTSAPANGTTGVIV